MTDKLPPIEQVLETLCDLWQPLSATQRELITSQLRLRSYHRKEIIYRCDDHPTTLFLCAKGMAFITRETNKHNRILAFIGPGDLFGFRSHFTSDSYYSTAYSCREGTVIATLPYAVVDRLISESPQISLYFTKVLARMLAISDTRDEVLTQKHLRGRLLFTLIYILRKFGFEEDGKTLNTRFTRSELGELSNMTTSNVIRTLSQLAREGVIATENKKIMIPDAAKLQATFDAE